MKIIDRYISRQFLINFVILSIVFMLLFVVVDLAFNLDEFLKPGHTRAGQLMRWFGMAPAAAGGKPLTPAWWLYALGVLWTIVDYYGPMVMLVYVFLCGLLVTAAMGFTFAALTRNREVIAVLGSGVSMYRLAVPVLVVGCALNLLTLPIQEFLIPPLASKLARGKNQLMDDGLRTFAFQYARDSRGQLMSAAEFDAARDQLTDVTILIRDADGRTLRRVSATTADWNEQDQGWNLVQAYELQLVEDGSPAPVDDRDLNAVDFFRTDLSPKALLARRASIYPRLLSLSELNEFKEDPTVPVTQIMHSRFSMMAVNVLVLVMGLPFFMLREPSNMLMQAIKAATVCIGAWSMGLVLLQAGGGWLNPVAAAWLPVIVYLPVSAALLQAVKS